MQCGVTSLRVKIGPDSRSNLRRTSKQIRMGCIVAVGEVIVDYAHFVWLACNVGGLRGAFAGTRGG